MAKELEKVQYYFDSHTIEEDVIDVTTWHSSLITYLKQVLDWLFHEQSCAIYQNLAFYHTPNRIDYPARPDLAVIKGMPFRHMRRWVVANGDPPPQVVFEILSEETWEKDLQEKPSQYARLGVQEYFTYDPHEPPLQRGEVPRLLGWQLDAQVGEMVEMVANTEGWLWSEQLESWLVPDEAYLRLCNREHQMRLTEPEAQSQHATIEAERTKAEARRAEAALRKAQALAEQLRSLGINPDEI